MGKRKQDGGSGGIRDRLSALFRERTGRVITKNSRYSIYLLFSVIIITAVTAGWLVPRWQEHRGNTELLASRERILADRKAFAGIHPDYPAESARLEAELAEVSGDIPRKKDMPQITGRYSMLVREQGLLLQRLERLPDNARKPGKVPTADFRLETLGPYEGQLALLKELEQCPAETVGVRLSAGKDGRVRLELRLRVGYLE